MRYALAPLLIVSSIAAAATGSNSCLVKSCGVGDRAITYATKSEPFYACPTRELASYTSTVVGVISMQYSLTGTLPNISDKTGEPEYLDSNGQANQTRMLLDGLRRRAGVATFDQAAAACSPGRNKAKVTILNLQKDDGVAYVHDDARKLNYWMPTSSLDKR
ncbi:TPA: hypothetical protein VDB83_001196 [Burkholderia cenocepacia]|uniref:hypothetical protein n=1 Tax=Burkholderia cenocepacia TaxID=95486 RepID=UPI001B9E1DE6|nr:hypothetical protein [Burkholderia cenocepacia]MBR8096356.1 hypothetical protein [Burkholderia cenocepacia]HEP6426925.1 hypothetical protein [Burkholderia cenocepacia]